jgi:hypothetical protein
LDGFVRGAASLARMAIEVLEVTIGLLDIEVGVSE